jgi:nucleotide-binding universal stress UspA family protein
MSPWPREGSRLLAIKMERILACIDRGPRAASILRRATALARRLGAQLTVIHVAEGAEAEAILERAQATDAQLIVLGARGIFPQLSLGPIARAVAGRASRPILIVG